MVGPLIHQYVSKISLNITICISNISNVNVEVTWENDISMNGD